MDVRAELEAALALRGHGLHELHCGAVALFGSRAVGCSSTGSDWDLLLIDAKNDAPVVPGFDFVSVKRSDPRARAWHAGELGIHVRRYGVWVFGEAPRQWDVDFARAAARKHHVLDVRVRAIRDGWRWLAGLRREQEVRLLRRDLQRLAHLCREQAVPPRQLLDVAWELNRPDLDDLCRNLELDATELEYWLQSS